MVTTVYDYIYKKSLRIVTEEYADTTNVGLCVFTIFKICGEDSLDKLYRLKIIKPKDSCIDNVQVKHNDFIRNIIV